MSEHKKIFVRTYDLSVDSVQNVLDDIRPFLLADGGDIRLVTISERTVSVMLTGACRGCPLASFTMQFLVESELKKYIPEISKVVLVDPQVDTDL